MNTRNDTMKVIAGILFFLVFLFSSCFPPPQEEPRQPEQAPTPVVQERQPVELVSEIEPVRVMPDTTKRKLEKLPTLSEPEQKILLNEVIEEVTASEYSPVPRDTDTGHEQEAQEGYVTLPDLWTRILNYLNYSGDEDISSIEFYLVNAHDSVQVLDKHGHIHAGSLVNRVAVLINGKYGYLLECSNGLSSPWESTQALKKKKIGTLKIFSDQYTIHFGFDSYDYEAVGHKENDSDRRERKRQLELCLASLEKRRSPQISINGHASTEGSSSYNETLSLNRAQNVYDFIQQHGIRGNFAIRSYGETRPVKPDFIMGHRIEENARKNRRVEVFLQYYMIM